MSDLKEQLQRTLSGNYTLERELGGGGMSRVFVAEETSLGRKVVVKVLPPELAAAVNLERFRREIQVAARLSHPHIVPVLAAGSSDGLPYYTMPFIEGESLRARISRNGELPVHDAARILRDVLSALAYAHEHGVVHRDIKPDNVLLSGGHALVADFGVAKALSASTDPGSSLTSMGVALGTPAYMAPEQAVGDPSTDHRADLYAVGAVAYEMLTGYQVFSARSPQAMLAAHAAETPEPILKRRATVPPMLASLVMRALEKRPADRPQTASEMLSQLEAATTPSGAMTPHSGGILPHQPGNNSRRNLVIGAAAVIALAVSGYGVSRIRGAGAAATPAPAVTTPSLAVLPFENLGRAEDAYFADGMTEEISSRLGDLSGLRIIGRQSVRAYANSNKPVQQIGKELGVTYILTGSVRWDKSDPSRSRVRVSPALLRTDDGTQVWSAPYEDEVKGIFQIQSKVAEQVANALRLHLTSADTRSLAERPTNNVEAYDYYLRGQSLLNGWIARDFLKAAGLFQKAIDLDPKFVNAYAGLANAHVDAFWFVANPSPERVELARKAADRALELDPNSAVAHSAKANYYYHGHRDYAHALQELEIAEKLSPNDVSAYLIKSRVLRRMGKWSESIDANRRAIELDPRNEVALLDLSESLRFTGHFAEARKYAEKYLNIDPSRWLPYYELASTELAESANVQGALKYLHQAGQSAGTDELAGNLMSLNNTIMWPAVLDPRLLQVMQEAKPPSSAIERLDFYYAKGMLAFLKKDPAGMRHAGEEMKLAARSISPGIWAGDVAVQGANELLQPISLAHAYLGEREAALTLAQKGVDAMPASKDALQTGYVAWTSALVATIVGDKQKALSELERIVTLPIAITPAFIKVDPTWESLRGDPRFIRLTNSK